MAFRSGDEVLSDEQALLLLGEVAQTQPHRRSLLAALSVSAGLLVAGVAVLMPGSTATAHSKPEASLLSLSALEPATQEKKNDDQDVEEGGEEDLPEGAQGNGEENNEKSGDDSEKKEESKTCAKKGEENCYDSKCCKDPGYQCYEKGAGWAVCKQECDKEEMQKYDPKKEKWSCESRGERNNEKSGDDSEKEEDKCAKKDEENCYDSKCCKDLGYQCYEKMEGWAVCKEECDKKEMQKYDPKKEKWSCEPRGERNRCAKSDENCALFGCCETPGAQCFKKNEDWSMCFETCDPAAMKKNDPKKEAWSCDAIGERNFKSKCAWAGEDCGAAKCCNNIGFTCAVKDELYTGCTQTIKKTTWVTQAIPIPAEWDGTVLGQGRGEYAVNAVPEGGDIAGTSLFCFMVYLPKSDEESLMWLAKKNGVSIFGCDKSLTLQAWKSGGGKWDTGETTLINTDVFTVAFESVREDGEYLKHDWTVKVDPDCVFFADRLRSHLTGIRPPPYTPMYIKNNDMDPGLGNNGFLGAIEIFSTIAMQTYFANAEGCKKSLGSNSGEDGFFKLCMDSLGVGFMLDGSIFAPDFDPQVCMNGDRVAYHPIKEYDSWQACVDIVMGVPRSCPFAKCDDGAGVERPWMVEVEE